MGVICCIHLVYCWILYRAIKQIKVKIQEVDFMLTKRKLREEMVKLNCRIAELEERLCPCEEHDWKHVGSYVTTFTSGLDFDTVYQYKCKRCGKLKETI